MHDTRFPSPAVKTYQRGTHRAVSPRETVDRALAMAQRVGITRVANITGLDTIGLPVVAVYRPNSRSLVVSQGKGLDLMAAKASGLMEAIEAYHAENIECPLRLASYDELRSSTPHVVAPDSLPRVSVGTFHPGKRILWCEGHDLARGGSVWVPYEMVHTDFTLPLPTGSGCFVMSSNGLASGNHWLEAVSHGICEVVERDAVALWSLDSDDDHASAGIDLETVDDPACKTVLEKAEAAGVTTGVWDVTTNVGIASFACAMVDARPNPVGDTYTSHGSGCHVTREIALLRALTEAAQTRLTYIAGARDDGARKFFEQAREPTRVARVRAKIDRSRAVGRRSFLDAPTFYAETFDEDVAWQVERLAAVGIERVVAVDLTLPSLGVPVVRMILPGIEGFLDAPGYVPGRRARARLEAARA